MQSQIWKFTSVNITAGAEDEGKELTSSTCGAKDLGMRRLSQT